MARRAAECVPTICSFQFPILNNQFSQRRKDFVPDLMAWNLCLRCKSHRRVRRSILHSPLLNNHSGHDWKPSGFVGTARCVTALCIFRPQNKCPCAPASLSLTDPANGVQLEIGMTPVLRTYRQGLRRSDCEGVLTDRNLRVAGNAPDRRLSTSDHSHLTPTGFRQLEPVIESRTFEYSQSLSEISAGHNVLFH